jgi:predicted phosphodiesterase
MNILVLSDLHIDPHDSFGIFQWDETDLIEQIENMINIYSIEKVIFNGDTFELLKYSFEDVRKTNPVLMEYFKRENFIFIRGNHDIVNDFGLLYYRIINSQRQTIHIEHGHNADWFDGTRFGRTISKFGLSLLRRMSYSKSLMKFYFKLIDLDNQISQIPKRYNTIKYLTYALNLLKEHDVVILGHTHKLESHHTYYLNKKKRYLNSGSCSLGRFQGIIMDTETLKYELINENKFSMKELYQMPYAI